MRIIENSGCGENSLMFVKPGNPISFNKPKHREGYRIIYMQAYNMNKIKIGPKTSILHPFLFLPTLMTPSHQHQHEAISLYTFIAVAKCSVTSFNLLNIWSPFCLITEGLFFPPLWSASCSLLFSECTSVDNQELTAQRLISVRFQIRETIKEMCWGRKDQWNRSHCLTLQVWCQTVWQSLHVTTDLPLLPCQCGAVTRLSPAWVLSLLLCCYSCLPPRSGEWAASFAVKGSSCPVSHDSIKSGGVRSGGRRTKVWGSNTFSLKKLWLPICPCSSLFLFLLPPTLTIVTSGPHEPCMLSSLEVVRKPSPFSVSFYTMLLLVLNSTWVGTTGRKTQLVVL